MRSVIKLIKNIWKVKKLLTELEYNQIIAIHNNKFWRMLQNMLVGMYWNIIRKAQIKLKADELLLPIVINNQKIDKETGNIGTFHKFRANFRLYQKRKANNGF